MSKLGDFMINEKTRVTINLATLITVVVAISTGIWALGEFKGEVERRLCQVEYRQDVTEIEVKGIKALQTEVQADMVEIKTDVKWIRTTLFNLSREEGK